jgi:hypothetical protein
MTTLSKRYVRRLKLAINLKLGSRSINSLTASDYIKFDLELIVKFSSISFEVFIDFEMKSASKCSFSNFISSIFYS